MPDPDVLLIEKAVSALEDLVIDWPKSFDTIAGDLSGLISVNAIPGQETPTRTTKGGWGPACARAVKAFFVGAWGTLPLSPPRGHVAQQRIRRSGGIAVPYRPND